MKNVTPKEKSNLNKALQSRLVKLIETAPSEPFSTKINNSLIDQFSKVEIKIENTTYKLWNTKKNLTLFAKRLKKFYD